MNEQFVRDRITQLRLQKGISEYQMSYALGHSRGYINNISSGKSLPSMNEFFVICEYFGITPIEFFDEHNEYPEANKRMIQGMDHLSEDDFKMILQFIQRLLD